MVSILSIVARMAELADALDLGSSPVKGGGSTPPPRMVYPLRRDQYTHCQEETGDGYPMVMECSWK